MKAAPTYVCLFCIYVISSPYSIYFFIQNTFSFIFTCALILFIQFYTIYVLNKGAFSYHWLCKVWSFKFYNVNGNWMTLKKEPQTTIITDCTKRDPGAHLHSCSEECAWSNRGACTLLLHHGALLLTCFCIIQQSLKWLHAFSPTAPYKLLITKYFSHSSSGWNPTNLTFIIYLVDN